MTQYYCNTHVLHEHDDETISAWAAHGVSNKIETTTTNRERASQSVGDENNAQTDASLFGRNGWIVGRLYARRLGSAVELMRLENKGFRQSERESEVFEGRASKHTSHS